MSYEFEFKNCDNDKICKLLEEKIGNGTVYKL